MSDVAEAEVVEEPVEEPGTDIAEVTPNPAPTSLAVTPQVTASDLVERLGMIREAQENAMVVDTDYGVIPGTDKPALLKPGAEKLAVLFQLDVQLDNEKQWGPGEHLTVISSATVFHAPTGARLGYGEGVCATRERKYAKRRKDRTCPSCGAAAVIKGKAEYGGGWLCWKKRNGCGAKFGDGDKQIEGQEVGEIDNPDLPDLWNTVVKMAEKRARVDAVLAVTGASALFTQDVEDSAPAPVNVEAPPSGSGSAEGERQGRDSAVARATDAQAVALTKLFRSFEVSDELMAKIVDRVGGVPLMKVAADDLIARLDGEDGAAQLDLMMDELSLEERSEPVDGHAA